MCEFCGNDKDIIFPFQLNKCQRCEGEPSLLEAGVCGSRAPSLRPSILLTWKDWKIPKYRRLARALYQDRREGEGGEEDLEVELDEGKKSGEQEERGIMKGKLSDAEEVMDKREGIFQAFTSGKLITNLFRDSSIEDEQEMTGSTESEREDQREWGGKDPAGVYIKNRVRNKDKKDKANLLKIVNINRLKKCFLKVDRLESDSDLCSSRDSLNEAGQEGRRQSKVSGLWSLSKGFSKMEREDEVRSLDKVVGAEEKGKVRREDEETGEKQDKDKTKEAETVKTESDVEKFTVFKLLRSQNISTVFLRGIGKEGEDKSEAENSGVEVEVESPTVSRSNWRGYKTRIARKQGTKVKKTREGTVKEIRTEDGERAEEKYDKVQ